MTQFAITSSAIAGAQSRTHHPVVPLWQRLLLRLAAAERERRERQQMAELCDATLRDLGLSRADIWAELNKSDWRR